MLRQLARFVCRRRGQVIEEWLTVIDTAGTSTGTVSHVNKDLESLLDAPHLPAIAATAAAPIDTRCESMPCEEFVEMFRELEQVRKVSFAVWWASRAAVPGPAVAA